MANLLIVGANRGIGYYFVERALALGHTVTVLDVEIHAIEDLKAKYPGQVLAVAADARDQNSISYGVQKAMETYGDIDIAVHNACVCTFESERDTEFDVYKDVMDVNFFGALRLIKAVLPPMRRAKKGRIILTSSGVGVTGFANISPYAASKGAIESLAKCLQIENAEYGISFHLFHPPLTNTSSAAGLPVPKEFMADAKKVGYGLADRMGSKKFVICPSLGPALQMKFSYRHPLFVGKLMTKATQRAQEKDARGE